MDTSIQNILADLTHNSIHYIFAYLTLSWSVLVLFLQSSSKVHLKMQSFREG